MEFLAPLSNLFPKDGRPLGALPLFLEVVDQRIFEVLIKISRNFASHERISTEAKKSSSFEHLFLVIGCKILFANLIKISLKFKKKIVKSLKQVEVKIFQPW